MTDSHSLNINNEPTPSVSADRTPSECSDDSSEMLECVSAALNARLPNIEAVVEKLRENLSQVFHST